MTTGETTHQCNTSSIGNPPLLHHVKVGGQKETGGAKALGIALIRQTGGTKTGHLVSATIANHPGISPDTAQHHSRGSPRMSRTTFISSFLVAKSADAQGTMQQHASHSAPRATSTATCPGTAPTIPTSGRSRRYHGQTGMGSTGSTNHFPPTDESRHGLSHLRR
jgi:hypothetical protein